MRRAIALARRGSGFTSPNPLVGAVIVREGVVQGFGWHRRAGGPHAEREALDMAQENARGGTLYVSLEPCNHYGRTSPCVDAILAAGISRVVVGARDANPHVKGGGIARLREYGVDVDVGLLADDAEELNRGWTHWITTGYPFVLLKLAVSLDGKIARKQGEETSISSPPSRSQVQRLRRYVDAVLVGSGTVLSDNSRLTNRTGRGRQPLRVLVDSTLSVDRTHEIFQSPGALVATTARASYERRRNLELAGVEIVVLDDGKGRVDLRALLEFLGKRGIQKVLCEGGGRLATSFIVERLCHQLLLYHSSILIGEGGVPFWNEGELDQSRSALLSVWSRKVGRDIATLYEWSVVSDVESEKRGKA